MGVRVLHQASFGGRVIHQVTSGWESPGIGSVRMRESWIRQCQDGVAKHQRQSGHTGGSGPYPDGVKTDGAKQCKVRTQR